MTTMRVQIFKPVAVIIIGACLLLAGMKAADAEDCLMCHPDLKGKKVVHPAVEMGCTSCHTGLDVADIPHKVTNKVSKGLSAEPPELCYGCHDKGPFSKKEVHTALSMGCTSCHDPHSSDNARMLLSSPPGLCYNCHDKGMFTQKNVHPALQMGCTSCHSPHSSDNDNVLLTAPPDLCYNCHDKGMFSGKKIVHPPVAAGMCVNCHSPHSSQEDKLLLSTVPQLCFTCHEEKKFKGRYTHPPVQMGMCITCHEPHQGERQKLLVSDMPELCYSCHDRAPFERKNVHPALMMGCGTCHNPHASEKAFMLPKSINDTCTSCHNDASIASGLHVVRGVSGGGHPLRARQDPVRKGRRFSCTGCHDPHSSDWVRLFRYKANQPFELCRYCHNY